MKKLKFKSEKNQNLFTSKLARIYLSNRSDLDKTETSIAKALLDWGENEDNGICFRTNNDLANDTKISVRTIQRTIKQLADKKLLIVNKSFDDKGKQLGNDYVLLYYKKFMRVDISEDKNFESIIAVAKRDSLGEGDIMTPPIEEIITSRGDTMTPPPCHHVIGEGDTMTYNDKELIINKHENVVVVEEVQDFLNKNNISDRLKEPLSTSQKEELNKMYATNSVVLFKAFKVFLDRTTKVDKVTDEETIKTAPFNFIRNTFDNILKGIKKGEEEKAKKKKEKSEVKEQKAYKPKEKKGILSFEGDFVNDEDLVGKIVENKSKGTTGGLEPLNEEQNIPNGYFESYDEIELDPYFEKHREEIISLYKPNEIPEIYISMKCRSKISDKQTKSHQEPLGESAKVINLQNYLNDLRSRKDNERNRLVHEPQLLENKIKEMLK